MRRLPLAFLLAALITGCTAAPGIDGGSEQEQQAQGLALTFEQLGTFTTETSPAELQLTVENVGQETAENVKATIYGASWISGSHTFNSPLDGVDQAAGQPGDTAITQWQLSPPDVDAGRQETFDATAQVSYDYTTSATIPVRLSPEGFVNQQSVASAATTAAPVQLSTDVETPIPTAGVTDHKIPVTVENSGGGSIASPVSLSGTVIGTGSGVSLSGCDSPVSVEEKASTTCTLTTPSDGVDFDTEAQIRLTASYTYRQETDTTVTVQGVQNAN